MNTINYIVKNSRTGAVVASFDTAAKALAYAKENNARAAPENVLHRQYIGPVQAFSKVTVTTETLLTDAEVIEIKGARDRVGRKNR